MDESAELHELHRFNNTSPLSRVCWSYPLGSSLPAFRFETVRENGSWKNYRIYTVRPGDLVLFHNCAPFQYVPAEMDDFLRERKRKIGHAHIARVISVQNRAFYYLGGSTVTIRSVDGLVFVWSGLIDKLVDVELKNRFYLEESRYVR